MPSPTGSSGGRFECYAVRSLGRRRLVDVWRRVLDLSWPVMVEQFLRTLMRTTDVAVTGLFSPAAVAAVGLADLYARLPLRIGLGLGSGVIALSSQDTGSGATANRDEAITQAILLGAVAGIPFIVFGYFFGQWAIAIISPELTPESEVARMGGIYLAIIFATTPARHVALVAARSIQGAGDTRTPMSVNVVSNALNIVGTVVLGLGLGPAPYLHIVGVGIATAVGNVFSALALVAAIYGSWTPAGFVRPTQWTITRQLLAISAPRITEGFLTTALEFPFNSILLYFGTDVNAAYQIGRRVYQQITSPLSRGYRTGTSIVVGQTLGEGDPVSARYNGWAAAALGVLTVGSLGVVLFFGAEWFVSFFTDDPATRSYAAGFAAAYALAAPVTVLYVVLAGALTSGSDTKTPLIGRISGMVVGLLGVSYVGGIVLGYGVPAIYVSIVVYYLWATIYVAIGFHRGAWIERTQSMMDERGSTPGED
ncbi:putative efflux protein, MATE family [Natronobacterium gregoryi]|uniref:Multidrug-efflux transporter n=3 Tax=Natronobacterium gregoryi TaxID=44930 RepID=L0AGH4_NATGS|nr:putative efflux protein, MATE family [Natronobacterium gregoryi SP2]SFJ33262.1 putative efflux protein, MATE family [Natronobacterium gregoryi]